MAKWVSAAAIRTVTAVLALVPPALLYEVGWLTVPVLSTDRLRAWVHQPLTAGFIAMLGYAGAWALWALLVAAVTDHALRCLAARLRWRLTLHLPGPLQALAAALLGTTAVTTAAALPAAAHDHTAADTDPPPADTATPIRDAPTQPPPADPLPPRQEATTTSTTASAAPPLPTESARHASLPVLNRTSAHPPPHASGEKVRVVAGDSLWDLAAEHLGDATRWREIYALNRGHRQANGYALTNPDTIHVGWKLTIPSHQATSAPAPPRPEPPVAGNSGPATPEAETSPSAPSTPQTSTAPQRSTPPTTAPSTSAVTTDDTTSAAHPERPHTEPYDETGIVLPVRGWISLGLAAAIAAVAMLLRLQRRRHARLTFTTAASATPHPAPVPPSLAHADAIGRRHLGLTSNDQQPAHPIVPAPIGVDGNGTEVSLFRLPGSGLALHGKGAVPAARAILAAVLTTGAADTASVRPIVVTTASLLAQLLPEARPMVGLDPDGTAYDGERLIVLADTDAAVTHAEEEMTSRRRLLDTFDTTTIADLHARSDHAETPPPYVLLIESTTRYAGRVQAIATHRSALDLHPIVLGPHDGLPSVEITRDGTTCSDRPHPLTRVSTLSAENLAAVLAMLTDAQARPEPGIDIDDPAASATPTAPTVEPCPVPAENPTALVHLRVLGRVTVTTAAGPVTTGMRSGSYTVLAVLAAHPAGRTLYQLAADLHPDVNHASAVKRVRTDITTARRVLRTATGHDEHMFIVFDPATGRYHLDPQTVTVDLWHMLTAINQAATSDNDDEALAALRRATDLYMGDFAEGHDHPWAVDYATSYRHQVLTAYARIAEFLEPDHPDRAVAALERATDLDPVNEELYQRIMRIHGRRQRPDAVRRTLRRLEERLADLLDAEPSQATRRVAERQFAPAASRAGRTS
ncbi:BTAD domain-containing putative transcriptional regulator [Micromonospora humida]|uniref:LysM peptidoglycan-binding domain-containing protein n=1 Tax=Micromonospora humida TaxID=2809018 RepID=A0ABS2J1Q8_9ACTN|nr:BTAD domain-containing putative transcriptional regulator [Micromonospora humida]MBM7079319.1 LysM peptidoglycan-binding domain-containing protein [Micromonospora humida]